MLEEDVEKENCGWICNLCEKRSKEKTTESRHEKYAMGNKQ